MIAPLKTFIIYSSRDRSLRDDFLEHLQPLVRAGKIRVWSDRDIPPGEPWNDEIREKLEETELFIPLVSKSFFASEYITTVELPFAEERRQAGMAFLIPVWLNHCVYRDDPIIGSLGVIPKDTPVTSHKWENTDAAWSHVVQKISSRVDQIRNAPDFQDRRTDTAAWGSARSADTVEALEAYLADPRHRLHRREAEERLKVLRADAAAWGSARSADTVEALKAYLADPRHRLHRREAEERLEVLRKVPKPKPSGGPLPIRVVGIAVGVALLLLLWMWVKNCRPSTPSDSSAPQEVPVPDSGPDMVFVRGGTFEMGDVMGDGEESDETVHLVRVADFYIGRTEVTFEEYDRFCEATGREKPGDAGWGRGRRPVINVSWYDAVEYCNWLSARHGLTPYYTVDKTRKDPNNNNTSDDLKWTVTPRLGVNGYRLPTEAEWEYAARENGEWVRFGFGKDIADPREINFNGSAAYEKPYSVAGEYRKRTVPVGSLNSPSLLGLHDMHGNVWEWCWDWYGPYSASGSAQDNPQGAGKGSYRVRRGGSWSHIPQYCRAAYRGYWNPANRGSYVGFRLARS